MDEDIEFRAFCGTCRLFPLPGVVLFPHAVLPLHIFEPRYRQMTEHALAGDRLIAIVQTVPGVGKLSAGEPELEEMACLGRILKHERLPDGRFNFLLQGRKRIRIIKELDVDTLYRQARVEVVDDIEPLVSAEAEHSDLIGLYREVARLADGLSPEVDAMLNSGQPLGVLTDLVAQSLGLPPALKQRLLEDRLVERRADELVSILRQVVSQLGGRVQTARPFPPPFSEN